MSEVLVEVIMWVVVYLPVSWTHAVFATVSSREQSVCLGTEFQDQINLKNSGLDKFLYSKVS